ncbi:hypothetical protein PVAP13_5NG374000 [Panicum virgatum]|uniref:Uncharacterized protein n=1 Tax=Panicum virgatum TaxID=38727 RepID=A0A8T0RYU5_PANVG|nr:hypothetical protein PVAP13_5NG374000 [Panicum virgatum]
MCPLDKKAPRNRAVLGGPPPRVFGQPTRVRLSGVAPVCPTWDLFPVVSLDLVWLVIVVYAHTCVFPLESHLCVLLIPCCLSRLVWIVRVGYAHACAFSGNAHRGVSGFFNL